MFNLTIPMYVYCNVSLANYFSTGTVPPPVKFSVHIRIQYENLPANKLYSTNKIDADLLLQE